MGIAILESIPTSIQVLAGVTAIGGAGWTWFMRPRIAAIVTEALRENRKEIAATRNDLSLQVAGFHQELAATRNDLSQELAATRNDLSREIAATRKDLSQEIAATRNDLSREIAATRKDLSREIAGNRDSIMATRDLVSAVRIETRDLLDDMRRENHEAHEAIGARINGLQGRVADLKAGTSKLTGAVEVLMTVMRSPRADLN